MKVHLKVTLNFRIWQQTQETSDESNLSSSWRSSKFKLIFSHNPWMNFNFIENHLKYKTKLLQNKLQISKISQLFLRNCHRVPALVVLSLSCNPNTVFLPERICICRWKLFPEFINANFNKFSNNVGAKLFYIRKDPQHNPILKEQRHY